MNRALIDLPCACATSRQVSRLLTQFYDARLRTSGLEAPQFALLTTLDKAGPVSQAEMGKRYGLDKTTVSRNLKQLEQKGWVECEVGEDRRVRRYQVTAAGRERLAAARPEWKKTQDQLRAAMTPEQWDAMFAMFRNLSQTVVSLSGGKDKNRSK